MNIYMQVLAEGEFRGLLLWDGRDRAILIAMDPGLEGLGAAPDCRDPVRARRALPHLARRLHACSRQPPQPRLRHSLRQHQPHALGKFEIAPYIVSRPNPNARFLMPI